MNQFPLARTADVVVQILGKEVLIYDLNSNKAYNLNETSAAVYQACDGKTSANEISFLLGRQLKSPVTEDFVWLALDGLKKENLIEVETQNSMPFEGLSRREAIRKVGFASMIALPVISSLVAPTAASATSGQPRPNGAACPTGSANCASNCCAGGTCVNNVCTGGTCVQARTLGVGESCTANCECAQNNCGGAGAIRVCGQRAGA